MLIDVFKHLLFETEAPRSPGLNPLQLYLWKHLKSTVQSAPTKNEKTLDQLIFDAVNAVNL